MPARQWRRPGSAPEAWSRISFYPPPSLRLADPSAIGPWSQMSARLSSGRALRFPSGEAYPPSRHSRGCCGASGAVVTLPDQGTEMGYELSRLVTILRRVASELPARCLRRCAARYCARCRGERRPAPATRDYTKEMPMVFWIGGGILYLVLLFTLGILTIRKG